MPLNKENKPNHIQTEIVNQQKVKKESKKNSGLNKNEEQNNLMFAQNQATIKCLW